jgi:UDP-N-acetylmuramoyl-L-alanyl-D-glutamate--2,6-diaminopimelate ligase
MKLEQLLKDLEYTIIHGSIKHQINGVKINSQQIRENFVFVAIPGNKDDGWQYVEDAIAHGASIIISEKDIKIPSVKVTFIQVKDAHYAAGIISSNFYNNPSKEIPVIGITGTNGKTTTAFLIRSIFKYANKRTGMIGTVSYETGERKIPADRTTPNAIDSQNLLSEMIGNNCDVAIMEVSSHSIDQKRIAGIDFNVGIFTNLTTDHINYHKTLEAYFETKASFIRSLPKNAFAILNTDDEYSKRLIKDSQVICNKLTYGLSESADIRADIKSISLDGASFQLHVGTRNFQVKTSLTGQYNILNVLAAIAASYVQGIDLQIILEAIEKGVYVPGRLEEIENNLKIKVLVDYAHTQDALYNVLNCLQEIAGNNIITVFGCGGNRDTSKRPEMGKVATQFSKLTVITNDNPRNENPNDIIANILEGIPDNANIQIEPDRDKAIQKAIMAATPGDIVLIAGKGHETYQDFGNRVVPFDDRSIARKHILEKKNAKK